MVSFLYVGMNVCFFMKLCFSFTSRILLKILSNKSFYSNKVITMYGIQNKELGTKFGVARNWSSSTSGNLVVSIYAS